VYDPEKPVWHQDIEELEGAGLRPGGEGRVPGGGWTCDGRKAGGDPRATSKRGRAVTGSEGGPTLGGLH
jgi:hypothetical protein